MRGEDSHRTRPLPSAPLRRSSGRQDHRTSAAHAAMSAPHWPCVCAVTLLALVCHGSASSDDPPEQREVTFDISPIMNGQDILQREMDLSDLLSDFKQEPSPGFSPRATRPRPVLLVDNYPVQFPLARPSSQNIQSICLHGNHRPRYPKAYFPASGFGVQKREADAVNMLEAWFGTCCGQNQTEEALLCCAGQAWEKSIRHFCKEGFTIKAPHFHCCKRNSSEMLPCFDSSAPNPDYNPSEESPVQTVPPKAKFNFDPSSCPGTWVTSHSIRNQKKAKKGMKAATSFKVDLDFPLAVPTDSNFESICSNQKQRPRYNTKCLNGLSYKLEAHQAKSINHLEKQFKLCCKKKEGVLPCLQLSWRQELKKFCLSCKHRRMDYDCCDDAIPQFECFENSSTDPGYNKSVTEEHSLSLRDMCHTHKIITKKSTVGFPLKSVVNKCCHLSPLEKSACLSRSVIELFEATCSSRKSSTPSVQRCCRLSSAECFNKVLMDAIAKATVQRHKKRCPVVGV